MKVFIATPYTQFCDQNNLLKEEYKNFFLKLTNTLKEEKIDYFLALEREKWGEEYIKDSLSTEIDYNAVLDCDLFCGILGYPHSGGVHVECGWASANGKKMYLFLEEGRGYSPMITGLGSVTDVTYCTYQDLNNELVYSILDIIKKENK